MERTLASHGTALTSTARTLSTPPEALSNRLVQIIDGQVAPRGIESPEYTDESSLLRDEGSFSGLACGLADEDTTSDSEDNEERLERILNSSDTNAILSNLKLNISPMKIPVISDDQVLGCVVDEESDTTKEVLVDEFPLFPNMFRQSDIIEDERPLSTPEKRGFHKLHDSDSEEDSISKRTRSSAPLSVKELDSLSPISRKMRHFQNSKSRIPLSVAQIAVRRSKRLEQPEDDKGPCSPKNIDVALKPLLKIRSSSLNYIVDASSGFLHDATKYATEMNSLNCEGVPIPETANELVTIPINERKASKIQRSALLRGTTLTVTETSKSAKVVGFYSAEQYKKFRECSVAVEEASSPKKEKRLRWADDLEW